jgi:hypothetical protein
MQRGGNNVGGGGGGGGGERGTRPGRIQRQRACERGRARGLAALEHANGVGGVFQLLHGLHLAQELRAHDHLEQLRAARSAPTHAEAACEL